MDVLLNHGVIVQCVMMCMWVHVHVSSPHSVLLSVAHTLSPLVAGEATSQGMHVADTCAHCLK